MKNMYLGVTAVWILLGFAARAENVPYAFSYAGKPATWLDASPCVQKIVQDTDRLTKTVREWKSPDGKLMLRSTETVYKKFPVREYLPELVCAGDAPTEIVDDFRTLDQSRKASGVRVRALKGTVNTKNDFAAVWTNLVAGARFDMVATEGRSSAQWMPFWGMDYPEGDGVEYGVGWSGAWKASVSVADGAARVTAGMVRTHFRLLPGETLRQPSLLVMTRAKGVSPRAMQTLIHQFMVEEKCPRDAAGKIIPPLLPITAGGGNKTPEMMLKVIGWAKANKMPFDCFWVDAGWNGPAHMPDLISNCGNMWYHFVGDWRFNPTVHPDGNLARVADAAHAAGMKMLLWVEPERCVMDPPPPVYKEHREWILPAEGKPEGDKRRLNVNLGDPAARAWVIETISALVRDNKLDVYRQDFNLNTLPIWQGNDAPDRQGVTEAKYIAGLYAFWDELRRRFPHLIIENCASGGRRLDFEAISRAHSYCRTDYAIGHCGYGQITDVQRVSLNTLAYQPFQGSETTPAHFFDDYGFFSSVSGASVFTPSDWHAGIVKNPFTEEETAWFKEVFTVADRMRPYFLGDFYPLVDTYTPPATGWRSAQMDAEEMRWCAYQMHRPDLGAGFVLAFRRLDAPERRFTCDLGGIDDAATYEVETYGGGVEKMNGAILKRLVIDLPAPRSFKLLFYRRKS